MFASASWIILRDKSPRDNNGRTPLHVAASNGHLDVCKYIMEKIQDKNPRDNSGQTPIDKAHAKNHLKVVNFMENYNFEPKSKRRKVE